MECWFACCLAAAWLSQPNAAQRNATLRHARNSSEMNVGPSAGWLHALRLTRNRRRLRRRASATCTRTATGQTGALLYFL